MTIKDIQTIEDLTPDPNNARRHNPRNIGVIERSLNEVGAARSIVIDEDGVVLAGNATTEAAQQAGITRVRVVEADGNEIIAVRRRGLTPEQKIKLALADNRSAELAEWEPDVLASLADDMDLSTLFYADELKDLTLPSLPEAGAGGDEFVAELEEGPTRAQLGDLWIIGGVHRLIVGDCTDGAVVARLMGGERADLGMHDPPYGIDASGMTMGSGESAKPKVARLSHNQEWDGTRPDVSHLFEYSKYVCIWGGNYFADVLPVTNDWLCWWKNNDNLSFSEFELAWTNYGNNARHLTHHWGAERKEHITQKPLGVIEWAVKQCPDSPKIIVDFFAGSGTTLIAAHRTGRRCYGCEISPRYADVILRRAEAEGLPVERADG